MGSINKTSGHLVPNHSSMIREQERVAKPNFEVGPPPTEVKSAKTIPRKTKSKLATPAKSVIYGTFPHSRVPISQFKGPWVHAPGLSSTSSTFKINTMGQTQNQSILNKSKSFEGGRGIQEYDNNSTHDYFSNLLKDKHPDKHALIPPREGRQHHKHPSTSIKSKHKRSLTKKKTRKLRSQDSLVQVTNFLSQKREEIQQLWEHYFENGSPELFPVFESANRLALEAAEAVEALRQSIQDLHNKESSLSEEDADILNKLRFKVLDKIKKFEEINGRVQDEVTRHAASDDVPISSGRTQPGSQRSSQTVILHKNQNHNPPEDDNVVFIKKPSKKVKSPRLHPVSESDAEDSFQEYSKEVEPLHSVRMPNSLVTTTTAMQSRSNITTKTATTVPSSTIDLNKLTHLYNEKYDLPPVYPSAPSYYPGASGDAGNKHSVKFQEASQKFSILNKQLGSLLRRLDGGEGGGGEDKGTGHYYSSEECPLPEETPGGGKHYKGKVQALQRKLMEAEAEMKQLRDDLNRVESDSNFQVRLLKSSFEDRLGTLEVFPEYLQITESRLMESMQCKGELESVLRDKNNEIEKLLKLSNDLKAEVAKCERGRRKGEASQEQMRRKIGELEKANESLRRELETRNDEISRLNGKLEDVRVHPPPLPHHHSHHNKPASSLREREREHDGSPEIIHHLKKQNQKLDYKIDELKNRLAKSQKNVYILQTTKQKMESRMNQRQEELLVQLQDARARNRQLQNQLHYIRTTYHDLFPMEMFRTLKTHGGSKSSNHPPQSKETIISSRKKKPQPSAYEPMVSRTTTWVTGVMAKDKEHGDNDDDEYSDEDDKGPPVDATTTVFDLYEQLSNS